MDEKSILFAKLAGLYKTVSTMLTQRAGMERLIRNFRIEQIEEVFSKYIKVIPPLKKLLPEMYSDLEERSMPEVSAGGTINRDFLEMISRDIEYIFEINAQYSASKSKAVKYPQRVFISHGSSQDWRKVQSYIEKDLEIRTLELAQEPNKGRTVLQKLVEESENCSYAVVVMTGDDKSADGEVRARENVMHEIGFFQGKYGLSKVCLLYEQGTNISSNIAGLVYIDFPVDVIESTFGTLSRELKVYFEQTTGIL